MTLTAACRYTYSPRKACLKACTVLTALSVGVAPSWAFAQTGQLPGKLLTRIELVDPSPLAADGREDEHMPSRARAANGDGGRHTPAPTQAMPANVPASVKMLEGDTGTEEDTGGPPVTLEADTLAYDEGGQVVVARGNVELVRQGRVLRAETVRYDLRTDIVTAKQAILLDKNGDVHFMDEIELDKDLKNGFVRDLHTLLADGSRFRAGEGRRIDARRIIMEQASYTPCEPCRQDPDAAPVWRLRADKVTHSRTSNSISYENATLDVLGVPVLYTPYFSHPDGTVKRKSGFLTPGFGLDSELGASVSSRYYWAIAPHMDITAGVRVFTEQDPQLLGEFRRRFSNAEMQVSGSITRSRRTVARGDNDITLDEEVRGHLFGTGLWDINTNWRAGYDLELASDDQYVRQYDITSKDVLENELYVERFAGRNYAVGRLLGFQDVRIKERQTEQPDVLPEIEAEFIGAPDSLLGGRWDLSLSALGLRREAGGQDLTRLSMQAGWEGRLVTNFGLVNTLRLSTRGDVYYSRDLDVATPGSGRSEDESESRLYPYGHLVTRYPFARDFERFQAVVEPIASLTVAPNVDNDEDIPNEDSQDVQLDASNLFEPNRFPGYDRVEDNARVTYGLRAGAHGYGGSGLEVFIGQSYRLSDDNNPFPNNSGLEEQSSDIVGQVTADILNKYSLNYRFQLESENLASERHELYGSAIWGKLDLDTRYLYATPIQGTGIVDAREQINTNARYSFSDTWRAHSGMQYDLGRNQGLRRAYFGLDYYGQCLSLSGTAVRNVVDEATGDSETEVILRVGLKNLGEFSGGP